MYSGDIFGEGPRRSGRGPTILVVALILLAAAGGAYYYRYVRQAAPPGARPPAGPTNEATGAEDTQASDLLLPANVQELPGTRLYLQGRYAEAAAELESYLATGEPEETLQAKYVLAMAMAREGKPDEARSLLKAVIDKSPASPYAASALVASAILARASRDDKLADSLLDRAWTSAPDAPGGRRAALIRADDLYARYAEKEEVRKEWEHIRDAYSVALDGLRDSPGRKRVVERLARLNEYLVFSRRAEFSGAVFITVEPGDVLSLIAERHKVTPGFISRINELKSDVIHPGIQLKIVVGRAGIAVDKKHLRMTALLDGKFLREFPVGVGPGDKTPAGEFTIVNKIIEPRWYRRGEGVVEYGDPKNILGTRWLGFEQSGPGMGIGIHGSKDGEGVGERLSEGCIRMNNADVEELFDLAPTGTKVRIIE